MKRAVIALILIACLIGFVATLRAQPMNAGLPLIHASAPSQPAFRLFTTCPVDHRNIPILPDQRTA